jgi:ATP-binding cassette subfamily B protein
VAVIVGQRISTVRHANQILVLEDGQIVGLGTHQQLRQTCSTYQEIVASQVSEEEDES